MNENSIREIIEKLPIVTDDSGIETMYYRTIKDVDKFISQLSKEAIENAREVIQPSGEVIGDKLTVKELKTAKEFINKATNRIDFIISRHEKQLY